MSTFYLKYRPQKISHLDLKEIREQLLQVLSSNEIPHAFLFSGPRGLGKTSAARIVAKSVNCLKKVSVKVQFSSGQKNQFIEPCNKCNICKSITNGTCLDLIEIDAASNRGIDDIRELIEKIKLAPSQAKKKVYIIDEVHMLTLPAFNALLKTLEEPPEHAIFILCTTQPGKLPETIISRCQRLNFRLANPQEIARALKRIIKGENLRIKSDVLELISKNAGGSFRDIVKVLQYLSFGGKNISLKKSKEFFTKEVVLSKDILLLLSKKNTVELLKWIDNAVKSGVDLKMLTTEILEGLRRILLAKYEVISMKTDDYGFEVNDVKRLISIFDNSGRELSGSVIPQLPLELAIIEWCDEKNAVVLEKRQDVQPVGLEEKWLEVLQKIKQDDHSLEALLKSTKPKKTEGNKIVIEVFYEFHKNKLESEDYTILIERRIKEVFLEDLKIEYILRSKP